MNSAWLESNFRKVKRVRWGSCNGCAFEDYNRSMGYDFCEEIPCSTVIYSDIRNLPGEKSNAKRKVKK